MRPYGWAPIQYDWFPCERGSGHPCENKADHVREQPSGRKPRGELSEETNPTDNLILGCYSLGLWEEKIWASRGHLVTAAQRTLRQGWPVCYRMFSSVPGLLPTDRPLTTQLWQPKFLRTAKCPLRRKIPPHHWGTRVQMAPGPLGTAGAHHGDCSLTKYYLNEFTCLAPCLGSHCSLANKLLLLQLR